MKKIILLILLIPNMVLASNVYTEYEQFILNTNEYLEETDTLKREEVKLYNTYKEEIIEEKYMQINNTSSEYKIDYDDYIYEYQYSLDPSEFVYEYNTKCLNRNYLPRYMKLKEFSNQFIIKHAEILTDQIDEYKVEINPNVLDLDNYIIYPNSSIFFNFFKNMNILNFKMKLYLPVQDIENLSFKIEFLPYSFINDFKLLSNKENIINIHFDNNYYQFLKDNNFITTNQCINYYTLRIPLYKHYKINKITINNYIPLNDKDLFLMDDYKINYNYYKREKIEFTDSIILKNKRININDYILSSTIPLEDLKVVDNINYEESGSYNVDIYYKDNLLTNKEVNYIKETIPETKKVENNNQVINQEINSNTSKSTTKATTEKVSTIKTKTSKIITTNKTKMTTTNVKKINNKIVTSVKENKYQKPVLITVIASLLLLLIIFECILLYVKKKYY